MFRLSCLSGLWDGIGSEWLSTLRRNFPNLATEAWPGTVVELTQWLDSGLIDAALSTEPIAGRQIQSSTLFKDEYIQVSTHPREVMEWDPEYIYVDLGPEFRRQHAIQWTEDHGARMTFGDSRWALQMLLTDGGSAYLPRRLIQTHLSANELHIIKGSPSFTQDIYISWRETSLSSFPWLNDTAQWVKNTHNYG
jgi:DNA-binding transcriptional LysR family regulator